MTKERANPLACLAWHGASFLTMVGLTILAITTFRHYGNGFDAQVQDTYGQDIINWFRTFGADRAALRFRDLYYYGGLFDTLAALVVDVSPFPHWATRHLLEACFGLMGLWGTWRLAYHLAGARSAFLSLAALALMPSYYGMMFINPKDIPFAAASIWSIYALTKIVEELPHPSLKTSLFFGVTTGVALGIRIPGVLLYGYLFFCLTLDLACRTKSESWTAQKLTAEAITIGKNRVIPAVILSWGVMVLFWPWAQVSPLRHPLEALSHFASLSNGIDTLYFGQRISALYHPASYLPVYLVIKLPDIIVALMVMALGLGIVTVWQKKWHAIPFNVVPVLLATLFPLIYVMLTSPELYDAERHFLFVLPPLAVLVGISTNQLIIVSSGHRGASAMVGIVLSLGVMDQVHESINLHPYEYAYFNDLVGGTAGARGHFNTEYWGTSLAEATLDLRHYIQSHGLVRAEPWKVAFSGEPSQTGDLPHPHLQLTDDWNNADFYISTTRRGSDGWLHGTIIDRVERDGVPFAIIKDLRGTKHAGTMDAKIHG